MLSLNPPEVVEDGSSILWHTVVWPGGEMILHHFTRGTSLTSMLNIIVTVNHAAIQTLNVYFEYNKYCYFAISINSESFPS